MNSVPEWSSSKNNKDRSNRAPFIPPATSPCSVIPCLSHLSRSWAKPRGFFFFFSLFFSFLSPEQEGAPSGGAVCGAAPCPPRGMLRPRCAAGMRDGDAGEGCGTRPAPLLVPRTPKEPGAAGGGGGSGFGRYDLWRQMSRPAIENIAHCLGNGPVATGVTPFHINRASQGGGFLGAAQAGEQRRCWGNLGRRWPGRGSSARAGGRCWRAAHPLRPPNKGPARPGSASMKNCLISGESERLCFCRDVTFPVVKPALAANRDLIDG